MGYLNVGSLGSFLFLLYSQGSSIVVSFNFSRNKLRVSLESKAILPTQNSLLSFIFFIKSLNAFSVPQSIPSNLFFMFLVNQPYNISPSWLRVVLNLMNFAFFSSTTVPSENLLYPAPLKYSMLLTAKMASMLSIVQFESAIARRFAKLFSFISPSDFGVFAIFQVTPLNFSAVSFLSNTP